LDGWNNTADARIELDRISLLIVLNEPQARYEIAEALACLARLQTSKDAVAVLEKPIALLTSGTGSLTSEEIQGLTRWIDGSDQADLPEPSRADPGARPRIQYDVSHGPEILSSFLAEAEGHLSVAEAILVGIEPEEPSPERFQELFRALHSLKGIAGYMELTTVRELTHRGESLLESRRPKGFTAVDCDLLLRGIDAIREVLNRVEAHGKSPDSPFPEEPESLTSVLRRLEEVLVQPNTTTDLEDPGKPERTDLAASRSEFETQTSSSDDRPPLSELADRRCLESVPNGDAG